MSYRDPEQARAYQREYQREYRAGQNGAGKTRVNPLPTPFRLKTAVDVIALIEGQVAAVLDDRKVGTLARARTVGYLASVSLRAIEAGDLATRLEALEQALKGRRSAKP